MKLIFCAASCSGADAQKLWKIGVMTIRKTMNASAAQRAFQPNSIARPAPTSIRIAIAASTSGIGKPLLAILPTVPANPTIFPYPEKTNIPASRTRPSSAAQSFCTSACVSPYAAT